MDQLTGNDLPTTVTIGDTVLYQDLEDEVVLLNMANQQYYGLNEVGTQMWKYLMEVGDVAAASARLSSEYEADASVIRADMSALIKELLDAGLLKAI
jgi:hypothetical protein